MQKDIPVAINQPDRSIWKWLLKHIGLTEQRSYRAFAWPSFEEKNETKSSKLMYWPSKYIWHGERKYSGNQSPGQVGRSYQPRASELNLLESALYLKLKILKS